MIEAGVRAGEEHVDFMARILCSLVYEKNDVKFVTRVLNSARGE